MVERGKKQKAEPVKDAKGKDEESIKISIEQTGGQTLESTAEVADWEALCRQIQPHLQSAKPEQFNQLLKDHPLAKDLPEMPVRVLEPPVENRTPSAPKGQ